MSDLKKREKLAPSHIMSGEFTLYYLSVFISFNHHEGQLYSMDFNVISMLSNIEHRFAQNTKSCCSFSA